ncbi:phage Gp37/Gp68 family protein [Gluconacetobacter sp. 1c LMG 22058]|uniref:Phage Gp37/Gp68 family protein n=1 Tax=Gluconacetobacter dulcium TaxID=2729096 RepID=A0A7W4K3R2_9PROT|nr:phage Gp37/Gp68 family protein [Gluconacetobacter dulcium]MBB2199844.1 phage Gp37/Gp68 family protein [Gluconacetobacter dulcium]
MGANSGIEWTDHTFNPWVGCTKISPACDHCYAEGWAKRAGDPALWAGQRRRTSEKNWNLPLRWNRQAQASGTRARVFCASLADVFDNQVPADWRIDLWNLISATPWLDWLLLTKRPQNISGMLPPSWQEGSWPNVWLGTTICNQAEADRNVRHLTAIPAALRFLSIEPLLGPLTFRWARWVDQDAMLRAFGRLQHLDGLRGIDWAIVGGESGAGARPMELKTALTLRDEFVDAGTAFFFKQWGEHDEKGIRVGKKRAGSLLEGRTWRQIPVAAP